MEIESINVQKSYEISPYRWVMLLLFIFAGLMTNVIWVSFAPIISESALFYSVSENWIVILGASYMIAYIPVNFPSCYLIDKYGLKWGVGIGIIITGIFGFIRGIFAQNFVIVVIAQFMCAIGQPFILNSFTKMAVTWFPESEKTTATGLGTISTLIGSVIGLMVPEFLANLNISRLLFWYGIFCLLCGILYVIFAKDKPTSPPNPYAEKTRVLVKNGYAQIFKNRNFQYLMFILFLCLGIFNAFTTKIDLIFAGYDAGIISGILIVGGILGAIVLPIISDAKHKRKIFIVIAMVSAVVFSIGLGILKSNLWLSIVAFCFGFLLIAALPVGLTYAAEITYPVQEEVSNGILMWLGQIGGLILLLLPNSSFMFFAAGLFALSAIASFILKDVKQLSQAK